VTPNTVNLTNYMTPPRFETCAGLPTAQTCRQARVAAAASTAPWPKK
jgi:hypothetical protein